jgi:hypothetical protein
VCRGYGRTLDASIEAAIRRAKDMGSMMKGYMFNTYDCDQERAALVDRWRGALRDADGGVSKMQRREVPTIFVATQPLKSL